MAATTTRTVTVSGMAGGGVKSGFIYGATDEFGYHAVEDRMHVHDLHATILHLMGLDHKKLTYRLRWPGLPPDRCARRCGPENPRLVDPSFRLQEEELAGCSRAAGTRRRAPQRHLPCPKSLDWLTDRGE